MRAALTVLGRRPARSDVPRADLTNAQLPDADLDGAILSGARLVTANLPDADLWGAGDQADGDVTQRQDDGCGGCLVAVRLRYDASILTLRSADR